MGPKLWFLLQTPLCALLGPSTCHLELVITRTMGRKPVLIVSGWRAEGASSVLSSAPLVFLSLSSLAALKVQWHNKHVRKKPLAKHATNIFLRQGSWKAQSAFLTARRTIDPDQWFCWKVVCPPQKSPSCSFLSYLPCTETSLGFRKMRNIPVERH